MTSAEEFAATLHRAQEAEQILMHSANELRAGGLRAIARSLQDNQAELVSIADQETSLGASRLNGEIKRTAFQLDLFAELLESQEGFGKIIDHGDADWPPAPRPDLRRRLRPVGIVAVFAASNFPFAFSVVGGDTASALAAGCPVVVKAHSGHPQLSRRVAALAQRALRDVGLPEGALGLIEGRENGVQLVLDDRVDAVSFTGSTRGGRALFDLAAGRDRPIPFYGELGSVNPVFVTERAAQEQGGRIWRELAESFTLGAGQFCTKPGVVFVPHSADAPVSVAEHLPPGQTWRMLDERIASGFSDRMDAMRKRADVDVVLEGSTDGITTTAVLLRTDLEAFLSDPAALSEESFGPTTLLVEYDDESRLAEAARLFVGELTASLQAVPDDEAVPELIEILEQRAGRLIWNQWPTGVSVTAAMQHGGPYPASTSSRDTSVGTTAIDRFLRPVAYQNFPSALLPQQLRD